MLDAVWSANVPKEQNKNKCRTPESENEECLRGNMHDESIQGIEGEPAFLS